MLKKDFKNPFFLFSFTVFLYTFLTFLHAVLRAVLLENNLCDFKRYYAASRLLAEGGNIYQLDIGYHPLFFYLFRPFTFFSEWTAGLAWIMFLILLIFLCIKLMGDFFKLYEIETFGIPVLLFFGFITFSFSPLLEDLAVGQINVILLFFFVVILVAYSRKDWLCGLVLSLMVLLKVQFCIFFLFFLWKKRYKVVISAFVLYGVWTLTAGMLGGQKILSQYFNKIFFFLGPQNRFEILAKSSFSCPCIFIVLAKLFFNPGLLSMTTVKIIYAIMSFGLIVVTFVRYIKRSILPGIRNAYELVLVALLMLIVTPFTEEHHLIILIPAFCIMFFDVLKKGFFMELIFYLISFLFIGLKYSLSSFPVFNSGLLSLFAMAKFFGLIVLYFLILRFIIKGEKQAEKTVNLK